MDSIISASVGHDAANKKEDVRLVQRLLNDARGREGGLLLNVDGVAGPKTQDAILQFQRNHTELSTDGRVDPDGGTIKRLLQDNLESLSAGVIRPNLVAGVLGSNPPPDRSLVDSILQDYIDALKR